MWSLGLHHEVLFSVGTSLLSYKSILLSSSYKSTPLSSSCTKPQIEVTFTNDIKQYHLPLSTGSTKSPWMLVQHRALDALALNAYYDVAW